MGERIQYVVEYRWPSDNGEVGFVPFILLAGARAFCKQWSADGYKCRIIKETTTHTREVVK